MTNQRYSLSRSSPRVRRAAPHPGPTRDDRRRGSDGRGGIGRERGAPLPLESSSPAPEMSLKSPSSPASPPISAIPFPCPSPRGSPFRSPSRPPSPLPAPTRPTPASTGQTPPPSRLSTHLPTGRAP